MQSTLSLPGPEESIEPHRDSQGGAAAGDVHKADNLLQRHERQAPDPVPPVQPGAALDQTFFTEQQSISSSRRTSWIPPILLVPASGIGIYSAHRPMARYCCYNPPPKPALYQIKNPPVLSCLRPQRLGQPLRVQLSLDGRGRLPLILLVLGNLE